MPQLGPSSRSWDPDRPPPRYADAMSSSFRYRFPPPIVRRVGAAIYCVLFAVGFEHPEIGVFAIYLLARAIEIGRKVGDFRLSTPALWLTGLLVLLIFAWNQRWVSVAEVVLALFFAWAAGAGRRRSPGAVAWVLGLIALAALFPITGVRSIVVHGGLVSLMLLFAWLWAEGSTHAAERALAERLGGRFDLERHEIRVPTRNGEFVGYVNGPGIDCAGPLPPRAVSEGAVATLRACDCGACRSFDPEGESQTVRVDLDGDTVSIVHRGFDSLARAADQNELRALLRQLATFPHGKAMFTDGEMTLRAGAVPREVRAEGELAVSDWSFRMREQLFRLAFAFHDYFDRSANQAYR